MYELAIERLDRAGYVQYEISNWAKPGTRASLLPDQASHHNVAYWLNADYLAFGAGAHGHVYPRRWHDLLRVDEYIATGGRGVAPIAEIIELSAADLRAETMMMGLRLNTGVSYAHFQDRCGVELLESYGQEVATLEATGLLIQDDVGLRLTDRGRALGNQVFLQFLN
jgi:oxygen-independent coproporphyrinogen-3 oxidase